MNNEHWIKNHFGDEIYHKLERFTDLLLEWSQVHSGMTRADSKEEIFKNIVDSIYPLLKINSFENCIDIGTGAGFPGLIIAIARPNTKLFLVEPKAKRVAFLNFAKNSLGLDNCVVVHSRIESFRPKIEVDLITSRAVADVSLLLSLTAHICSSQTEYLLYKGSSIQKEMEAYGNIDNYEIFSSGATRNYLYIKRKGLL